MAPLRVAMVGAGWTGQRLTQAAAEIPARMEVAALVDNDADFLATTAPELGVQRTHTKLDDVLHDPDIEAISICTPHPLHAPMAIEAAAAGKHVLVTKPMATSVAEATAMLDAAAAANVVLYVAEHQPYEARFGELRRIVESGDHIGELTFAACIEGHRAANPSYPGRRAWLTQPEAGGTGMWALLGVHTIAALRSVLGEVVSVYILDHHASSFERDDLEATMSGIVELEGGLVVWLVQTTETRLRPRLTGFRLYGDAGTVIGHDDEYEVHPGEAERGAAPRTFPYPTAVRSPYAAMLDAFVDAVGGQAGGLTTGVSERRTLAVVEAGYESARTRQPVDLRTRYPGIWTE